MNRRGGAGDDPVPPGPSGLPVGDLPSTGPITSGLPVPGTVLAVGAHPDDIEFGCGATLARWAAGGAELHYVVLTDGSKGTWDPSADLGQLVGRRRDECRAAAEVVDGPGHHRSDGTERVYFLPSVDGELGNGPGERRALASIIRQVRPHVLLGHDPWRRYRLHPDHRAAGYLTLDALVAARDHHFFPDLGLEPHRPGSLLLWEADAPNHVEDADGFEEVKIDALWCHRSQLESTMHVTAGADGTGAEDAAARAQFGTRVRHQLAQHGSLAGLASAEAFRLMTDL